MKGIGAKMVQKMLILLLTLTPSNHGEHIITNCNIKHAFMI
jgi:hypothetical protein